MTRTAVDAFCGAGGLSIGLQAAGFDVVYAFDNDPAAVETVRLNPQYQSHPIEARSIEDVLKGVAARLPAWGEDLDLLAGGAPCQGFSVQRIGQDADERNDLVLQFFSLAALLRPSVVLLENVTGILGKRGRQHLDSALEVIHGIGYSTQVRILDAQDYGVPQRRRRVFVLAFRDKDVADRFILPAPRSVRATVRDAIGHLPSPRAAGVESSNPLHRADRLSELNMRRIMALDEGQGRQDLPDELLANCHLRGHADRIGHRNVYGRMAWDEVAPTITARFDSFTRGQFGHPVEHRSISLLEGALLQTFPEDYTFSGNKVAVARQIGNAVPPRLGEAIGAAVLRALEG